MDYFTYNSSPKTQAHVKAKALAKQRRQQRTVKSAYAANVLLAATAKQRAS